jgi:Rrf2 family protein
MHISAVEEYGLRCALQLAAQSEGSLLAASQIAEREGISVQYASKIMHLFRRAGLVSASRGMQGGFRLVKPANEISVKMVFGALREEERENFCTQHKGLQETCVHLKSCSVRPVWDVLFSYFDLVLDRLTLADLASNEAQSRKRVDEFARSEAEKVRQRLASTAPAVADAMGRINENVTRN